MLATRLKRLNLLQEMPLELFYVLSHLYLGYALPRRVHIDPKQFICLFCGFLHVSTLLKGVDVWDG